MQIGVDIGGSLTKIVIASSNERQYRLLEHTDAAQVAASLPPAPEVFLTGCGARDLAKRLETSSQNDTKIEVHVCDELRSFSAGARQLVREQDGGTEPFVLTSMGTGTSIFYVSQDEGTRAAGTGVGGGTITGLGDLLLSTSDFARLMDLADKGRRQRLDLMVSDLYPDAAESPVLSALTAANFGLGRCSADRQPEDIASAIVQMVVESVAVLSIQVARTHRTRTVVVAGSPSSNRLIRERFLEIGNYLGHEFAFLRHGAFCGAFGAILTCGR